MKQARPVKPTLEAKVMNMGKAARQLEEMIIVVKQMVMRRMGTCRTRWLMKMKMVTVVNGEDFRGYLQLYMSATRTRLIPASNPEDMPDTGLLNKDPSQHIAAGRQHAVRLTSIHPSLRDLNIATL